MEEGSLSGGLLGDMLLCEIDCSDFAWAWSGSDGTSQAGSVVRGCLERLPEEVVDRREGLDGVPMEARFANAVDVLSRAKAVKERRLGLDSVLTEAE